MLASEHLYSTTDINTVCGLCITVTMRTSHLPVYTTAVKLSLVLHKILSHAVICSVTVSPFLLGLNVLLLLFFFHFYHIVE